MIVLTPLLKFNPSGKKKQISHNCSTVYIFLVVIIAPQNLQV